MRRVQAINVPTDVLRTVAAIVDHGGFEKAGEYLDLSQPVIRAQMRQFQALVGGPIFSHFGDLCAGATLNDRGKLILPYLRRMLDANDQILATGGAAQNRRGLRLGLSNLFVEAVLKKCPTTLLRDVVITCDHSQEIGKGLAEGYVDVACLLRPATDFAPTWAGWHERFCWVRGPDFVVSLPGPVPLVSGPGALTDQIAIQALESKDMPYHFSFSSCDHEQRKAAVSAGLGIMTLSCRDVDLPLIEIREQGLPHLPPVAAAICYRPELDVTAIEPLLQALFRSLSSSDASRTRQASETRSLPQQPPTHAGVCAREPGSHASPRLQQFNLSTAQIEKTREHNHL